MTETPPNPSRVPTRHKADAELIALLDEIALWPDATLLHMHGRFAKSRLFRVHHDLDGPLTERARILLDATRTEIERRGLDNGEPL